MIHDITERAIRGIAASVEEALELDRSCSTDELCDAAGEITRARFGNRIDTCSIANARSGRCSEDCKWCAQSRHWATGIDEYDVIPFDKAMALADASAARGVGHFSLVTSGRRVAAPQMEKFCSIYREIRRRHPRLRLCASMGLLDAPAMHALREAGVDRYHCNLETSADYFPQLCSSHTRADKLATIAAARAEGMEVCSGGIIGMGETMEQRLRMVREAVEAGAMSVPLNILSPIPGTPLGEMPLLEEEEIVRTGALMRFVAPDVWIRFAGGRARMSAESVERMLTGGVNGVMIGDLLTTGGNRPHDDFVTFERLGLDSATD